MLKIGILIKKFDNLSNWELRIIDKIFKDSNYKLELLILDGRNLENNSNSIFKKLI